MVVTFNDRAIKSEYMINFFMIVDKIRTLVVFFSKFPAVIAWRVIPESIVRRTLKSAAVTHVKTKACVMMTQSSTDSIVPVLGDTRECFAK